MAKQYSITNLRQYDAAFTELENQTKEFITGVLTNTAKECFKEIVDSSVRRDVYKTGSYIASNRIGINSADDTDIVYKEPVPKGVAKGVALMQLDKLKNVKEADSIHISNSVGFSNANHYSWAANVEYTGWGSRGPYLIYEKALMKTLNNIDQIVDYVKAQTFE